MAKADDSPEFVSALEDLETIIGEWKQRCSDATVRVEACMADVQARVASDECILRELLEPPKIKSFGSVTLYPNRIVMNGAVRQLTPGMKTLAETRGNINRAKRSLLTRSAVGVATLPIAFGLGFFATPKTKKHDDREVVLIVEGSDWAEMTTYAPALQRDVVRFAKEIEATAGAWAAGQPERVPKAVAVAQRIREVQANSTDLHTALDALEVVRSESAAQEALLRVQARISEDDLKVPRDIRKRIEAAQTSIGELALSAPPPPPPGKGFNGRRTLTMADFKTESMGLAFRRLANDGARSLGRWQSNPASGSPGGRKTPLEDLLVIAETTPVPTAPGAEPAPALAPTPPSSAGDTVEALGRLAEMHTAGVLTDEEFAAAKARLLGT